MVIAHTGEQGTGTATYHGGYKQQNGYIFRLHGNYVGVREVKSYLQYDGHSGYDYAVGIGTEVYAAANGDVDDVHENNDNAGGKYLIINHKSGS